MKCLAALLLPVVTVACASSQEHASAPQDTVTTTSATIAAPGTAEQRAAPVENDATLPFDLPSATLRAGVNPRPDDDPATRARAQRDRDIAAAVHKAVIDDPNLSPDAKAVDVTVEDRQVILRGRVKTEQERMDIDRRARAAPGVVDVDDRIEVIP